jgi:pyridoxamine 5'-phosphate oxidase
MDDFYNDLQASFAEAQRLVEEGATNRRSAAHCPAVATLDEHGHPSQRTLILRHVDWTARKLRFNTDIRSTKIQSMAHHNAASVLFYLPDSKVQIRCSGVITMVNIGDDVDQAWDNATLFARRCYMATAALGAISDQPRSGLPAWIEGREPTDEEIAPARYHFALLHVEFKTVEWLFLANAGHRRARWVWNANSAQWEGCWLVP